MAENTADDLNLAAAQAAGHLLERCVSEHAAVLTPYVLRLFAALQNGHSFVWLDEGEAEELAGLAPTVGQGGAAKSVCLSSPCDVSSYVILSTK